MTNTNRLCPICGGNKTKPFFFGYYICSLCDSKFKDKKEKNLDNSNTTTLYNRTIKSIVEIYNYLDDDELSGTGVIINTDGYVLTSAHIVTKIASDENVTNFNNNIFIRKTTKDNSFDASIIFVDESIDLALLKMDTTAENKPISWSNKPINIGEHIFVIGNSKGEGLCIVDGIISDKQRFINNRELFMISAPVTTGCSGAPVLNQKGQIIGIVTGGRNGTTAMNYAIPINVIESFIKNKI